jgi:hypothetical protein
VHGSTDEISKQNNGNAGLFPVAVIHAQLRVRPIDPVPPRLGKYLLRASADCSPYRPSSFIRWRHYAEIRSSLPHCKSCLHSSANSAGDIGAEWGLGGYRCVCSLSTPDAMSAQLSSPRRGERRAQPPPRRLASHRVDTASPPGTDEPEWRPGFSGRPVSIFRVWFAVSPDVSMAMTLRVSLPVGPLGGRDAYPLNNGAARRPAPAARARANVAASCSSVRKSRSDGPKATDERLRAGEDRPGGRSAHRQSRSREGAAENRASAGGVI